MNDITEFRRTVEHFAAKVVEVVGTKIDIPRWKAAKKEIRELIAANTPQ